MNLLLLIKQLNLLFTIECQIVNSIAVNSFLLVGCVIVYSIAGSVNSLRFFGKGGLKKPQCSCYWVETR